MTTARIREGVDNDVTTAPTEAMSDAGYVVDEGVLDLRDSRAPQGVTAPPAPPTRYQRHVRGNGHHVVHEAAPRTDALPVDTEPANVGNQKARPTKTQRRRARWRSLRAWVLLLAVVAGAVALGTRQIEQRLDRRDRVALGGVALSSDPVDIVSTGAASVVEVHVRPQERVETGDVVVTIDAIRPAPDGGAQRVHQELVAPIDGVIAAVPTNAGAAVLPGGVLVRLYRPSELYFVGSLDLENASRLDVGMSGVVTSDLTGDLPVSVMSIEPALTAGDDGSLDAIVELRPAEPETVADLLPGIVFKGYVDQSTGSE